MEISVPAIEELRTRTVRISGDGTLALPFIGKIEVAGLTEEVREAFLDMPMRELTKPVAELLDREWVTMLPHEKNLELAHGTYIKAHKPPVTLYPTYSGLAAALRLLVSRITRVMTNSFR